MSEVVEEAKDPLFDNGPVREDEEKKGIVDWADAITQVNLAARALQDSLVNKHRAESRQAMDRLNKAAHDLNLYLISRSV